MSDIRIVRDNRRRSLKRTRIGSGQVLFRQTHVTEGEASFDVSHEQTSAIFYFSFYLNYSLLIPIFCTRSVLNNFHSAALFSIPAYYTHKDSFLSLPIHQLFFLCMITERVHRFVWDGSGRGSVHCGRGLLQVWWGDTVRPCHLALFRLRGSSLSLHCGMQASSRWNQLHRGWDTKLITKKMLIAEIQIYAASSVNDSLILLKHCFHVCLYTSSNIRQCKIHSNRKSRMISTCPYVVSFSDIRLRLSSLVRECKSRR